MAPFVGVLCELFREKTSRDVNWLSGIGAAYVRTFMNGSNVNPFNTIRYITLLSCLFLFRIGFYNLHAASTEIL